jgi:TPR repeat protein
LKRRILFPLLLLLLIPTARSTAQENSESNSLDSKQAELMVSARLKTMTPSDLQALMVKAQAGDAGAQCWLGRAYDGGLLPKDDERAVGWFLKSAEQGYAPAQRFFGLMFAHTNPPVSERWMLRAAEQGDAEAQFWLGVAYDEDWFGTTDVKEAVKWYQRAAERGNPDAQVELGQKYEDGEGVEQSFKLAAEWFQRAAEHVPDLGGAGQGRHRLGLLYMEGLGVPLDYVRAYFWFSLSGTDTTEAKTHLSPVQIREAERRVNEWKQQHRVSPEIAAAFHFED